MAMIQKAILLLSTGTLLALTNLAEAQEQAVGWQVPGAIQAPADTWQMPKEFQVPKGPWQTPGELQVPKGLQAVRSQVAPCETRLSLLGDALFDFDSADLRHDAAATLEVLGANLGTKPRAAAIEGHTDSKGDDRYNQALSERRAEAVQAWLSARGWADASWRTVGYGETRPVAPNTAPDGSDDPVGRQQNRRVEILLPTCEGAPIAGG